MRKEIGDQSGFSIFLCNEGKMNKFVKKFKEFFQL